MIDGLKFLMRFIISPQTIGSVYPSSRFLAREMTKSIQSHHKVLELGPGTGSVTQAILNRGVKKHNLKLIELDASLQKILASRYPGIEVINQSVTSPVLLSFFSDMKFDAVVSSLPLVLFSDDDLDALLAFYKKVTHDKSWMVQFTYAKKLAYSNQLIHKYSLNQKFKRKVFLNIPPAKVFHISLVR